MPTLMLRSHLTSFEQIPLSQYPQNKYLTDIASIAYTVSAFIPAPLIPNPPLNMCKPTYLQADNHIAAISGKKLSKIINFSFRRISMCLLSISVFLGFSIPCFAQYHFSSEQTINPADYIDAMTLGDKLLMGNLRQYHLKYNVYWNGDRYLLEGQSTKNGLTANLNLGVGTIERTLQYSISLETRSDGGVYVMLNWEFTAKNGQVGAGTKILGYLVISRPNIINIMKEGGDLQGRNQIENINRSYSGRLGSSGSRGGYYQTISIWTQQAYPHPENPFGMLVVATQHNIVIWTPAPTLGPVGDKIR